MNYNTFLKTKEKKFISSGFNIDESELNSMLFPFQKYAVKVALEKGRFALFEDCGLIQFFKRKIIRILDL
jgi:hypothetical protein